MFPVILDAVLVIMSSHPDVPGPNLPPAWRATPKRKDGIYLDGDQTSESWTGSTS